MDLMTVDAELRTAHACIAREVARHRQPAVGERARRGGARAFGAGHREVYARREDRVEKRAGIADEQPAVAGTPPVGHAEARLKEAAKLGFTEAWVPKRPSGRRAASAEGLRIVEIGHLSELVARLSPPRRRLVSPAERPPGRVAVAP